MNNNDLIPIISENFGNTYLASVSNVSAIAPTPSNVNDANYTALYSDSLIIFQTLTASRTVTVTPAGSPTKYKYWQIKDRSGNCSPTVQILLASTSGTFDGLVSTAISTSCGSKAFYDDGTNFFMCGAFLPSVNLSSTIQKADGNGGLINAVPGTDYMSPAALNRTTSALTLSLVGTGATGTQVSATNASTVRVNVSISCTATIGGPATSAVALKKCATDSATESAWTTAGILEIDQIITLAAIINDTLVYKGQLETDLPVGWFVKIVNTGNGTHSEAFIYGEQTVYG